jgi:hypothetical protein
MTPILVLLFGVHAHVNAGGQAIVGTVHPPAVKKSKEPM